MQMLLLLFLFRLGSLENTAEASEHVAVWGAREVMEEEVSHELLRQYPNLYFLHVNKITVAENTLFFTFSQSTVNRSFYFPFLFDLSHPHCEAYSSILFIISIKVACIVAVNQIPIVMANYRRVRPCFFKGMKDSEQ